MSQDPQPSALSDWLTSRTELVRLLNHTNIGDESSFISKMGLPRGLKGLRMGLDALTWDVKGASTGLEDTGRIEGEGVLNAAFRGLLRGSEGLTGAWEDSVNSPVEVTLQRFCFPPRFSVLSNWGLLHNWDMASRESREPVRFENDDATPESRESSVSHDELLEWQGLDKVLSYGKASKPRSMQTGLSLKHGVFNSVLCLCFIAISSSFKPLHWQLSDLLCFSVARSGTLSDTLGPTEIWGKWKPREELVRGLGMGKVRPCKKCTN